MDFQVDIFGFLANLSQKSNQSPLRLLQGRKSYHGIEKLTF
jgi:hypothetical protein